MEDKPIQKNKKRCYQCKCKLELAQRQIGQCRCGKYLKHFHFPYSGSILFLRKVLASVDAFYCVGVQ